MEEEKEIISPIEEKKKTENKEQDDNSRGRFYITMALLILLFLPVLSYPYFYMYLYDYVDTTEYLFRKGLNVLRYITLAVFLFTIGIRYLFENKRSKD